MKIPKITVEQIVFLAFACLFYFQLVRDTGIYQLVSNELGNLTTEDQKNQNFTSSSSGGKLENLVQKEATLWIMLCDLVTVVPGIGSTLLLSALSDLKGRKFVMLLGLFGMTIAAFSFVVLFTYPESVPIWAMLPCMLVCGLTGSLSIVYIASHAFLVDTVHGDSLTLRLSLLMVCVSTGQTLGTFLAGQLLRLFKPGECMSGAVVALGIILLYCFIIVPNDGIVENSHLVKSGSKRALEAKKTKGDSTTNCGTASTVLRQTKTLIVRLYETFLKKRPGWNRCFLLVGLLIFFINTVIDLNVSSLLMLFSYNKPLNWSPDQFGTWKAVNSITGSIGTLICVFACKRWLHMHDCALVMLGLFSCAAQRLTIGLTSSMTSSAWTMTVVLYASSAIGGMSPAVSAALGGIAARLVDGADEAGKLFGVFTVTAMAALIGATLAFNTLYVATIGWLSGFVFFVMAAMAMGAAALTAWLWWKLAKVRASSL